METIIVKKLEKKPTAKGDMLLVGFNGNRTASVAPWLSQEINYIEKDVGIGGEVSVELVSDGKFMNITGVDFKSANKDPIGAPVEKVVMPAPMASLKDNVIIAQVIVKCAAEMYKSEQNIEIPMGQYLCEAVTELVGAYRVALFALEK